MGAGGFIDGDEADAEHGAEGEGEAGGSGIWLIRVHSCLVVFGRGQERTRRRYLASMAATEGRRSGVQASPEM